MPTNISQVQVSNRYLDMSEAYSDRIEDRRNEFVSIASIIEEDLNGKGKVICSLERLDTAVVSYFYDVLRYKDFHDIPFDGKINFPKVFSFSAKWLLKEKPFYIQYSDEVNTGNYGINKISLLLKLANEINEIILIQWMLESHNYHSNKANKRKDDLVFSESEMNGLIYNFKFRDFDTGLFELFLEGKCSKKLINGF